MKHEMSEAFEAIVNGIPAPNGDENAPFKCGNWWPSIYDIKTKLEPKLEQNLEFLIWIEETADAPTTQEQKESQEYIRNLLKNTLVFVRTKEELKQARKEYNKNKTAENADNEDVDIIEEEDEDIDDVDDFDFDVNDE